MRLLVLPMSNLGPKVSTRLGNYEIFALPFSVLMCAFVEAF